MQLLEPCAPMAPDGTDALVAMDADGPTEKRIELDRGTSISVTPLYGVHGAIPLSQSCNPCEFE